ncbi:Alpha-galactosidase A [Eumeta japonica]|uniref:Alpha-galactosidase n=1 Tax=Eumeta variegata TaxID=151549 RepID=A0A4C1V282_EUMVA|nr:Alpha-galactosidase A [Eumeta japonica]
MLTILVLLQFFGEVKLLNNGLALTPPMGWMSWGYYMCIVDCDKHRDNCLNEKLILSVVDEFYTKGYQEAGYEYIIIDDCWSEKERSNLGTLVPDHKRFPRGMKYIADYIHSKGLKFGLYTSAGQKTCMGYPGSRNHLELDAKTFASWDVDYVKFDGCFVDEAYLNRGSNSGSSAQKAYVIASAPRQL